MPVTKLGRLVKERRFQKMAEEGRRKGAMWHFLLGGEGWSELRERREELQQGGECAYVRLLQCLGG